MNRVREPFRSILNDLRDGMAALERSAQPKRKPMSHDYLITRSDTDPEYMTSEEERAAELDAREKTIEELEAALEHIVDFCDDWDALPEAVRVIHVVQQIAKDALKKAGRL